MRRLPGRVLAYPFWPELVGPAGSARPALGQKYALPERWGVVAGLAWILPFFGPDLCDLWRSCAGYSGPGSWSRSQIISAIAVEYRRSGHQTMASLSQLFQSTANVVLYDQSDGLYGDLLDSAAVASSTSDAAQMHSGSDLTDVANRLQSVQYGYADNRSSSHNIPIEFCNYSTSFVRIRWVDTAGQFPPSHVWTLAPNQEWVQTTTAGHVFVLSAIVLNGEQDLFGSNETEAVLGAFRPRRALPSGEHHSVQVHDCDNNDNNNRSYILEVVLSDPTSYDALVVAASWLDKQIVLTQTRQDSIKTLGLLHTIISNVIKNPSDAKFRKLRLSNGTVERGIGRHWSAMEFLRALGFLKKTIPVEQGGEGEQKETTVEEEFLIAEEPTEARLELYGRAIVLLDQLKSRCTPGFVADVAPPTPWDEPVLLSGGSDGGGRWRDGSANFAMSDDDRWARVERARNFRSRAGRRPPPGQAPSDRGRWGRG